MLHSGSGFTHAAFDLIAMAAAVAAGIWSRKVLPREPWAKPRLYWLVALIGAVVGAYLFGTVNLWLMNEQAIGRSILGALLGGTIAIEAYKLRAGWNHSTGAGLVLPLALGIGIGRIGCLLSGMEDRTYGIPTTMHWGWDFGDGVMRHPVALYESICMLVFAAFFMRWLRKAPGNVAANGFYVFVLVYGTQRFVWEFLKPYPVLIGPLNLFHIGAIGLCFYAAVMLLQSRKGQARAAF